MMNMNQFTQKTMAALQRSQALAVEYGHQEVQQEHMMLVMILVLLMSRKKQLM